MESGLIEVGKAYLFMTLTFYWTGRVVALSPAEISIEDAAQVFDIGELETALTKWTVNLCQALPDKVRAVIPRQGTVSIDWKGTLPRKSKRD
jgi:hypothetical protein